MTIKETCSCGAALEFTANGTTAHITIAAKQKAFHVAHANCRPAQPKETK